MIIPSTSLAWLKMNLGVSLAFLGSSSLVRSQICPVGLALKRGGNATPPPGWIGSILYYNIPDPEEINLKSFRSWAETEAQIERLSSEAVH